MLRAVSLAVFALGAAYSEASLQVCGFGGSNVLGSSRSRVTSGVGRSLRWEDGEGRAGLLRISGGGNKHRDREDKESRHRERKAAEAAARAEEEERANRALGLEEAEELGVEFQEQLSEIHKEAVGMISGGSEQNVEEDQEEAFDEEERFSYFKKSEREVRKAEEAELEKTRLYEEKMEKRRRGELPPINEEPRDTLRWGDDREKERQADRERELYEKAAGRRAGSGRPKPASQLPSEDMAVDEWLEQQGMSQYAQLFVEEGWDTMGAVLSMSQEDLLELGVKKGHIRRIMLALGLHESSGVRSSVAPSSGAYGDNYREASYARGRMDPEPQQMRRRRPRWDDDIDIKPYAMDNPHEDLMREADRRDARYRHEEPVHTSVRIRYGPGGKSKLADAGGLGAFLNGGIEDEDRDRDDSTYLPRHRMIRDQKDEIVDRLERNRHYQQQQQQQQQQERYR